LSRVSNSKIQTNELGDDFEKETINIFTKKVDVTPIRDLTYYDTIGQYYTCKLEVYYKNSLIGALNRLLQKGLLKPSFLGETLEYVNEATKVLHEEYFNNKELIYNVQSKKTYFMSNEKKEKIRKNYSFILFRTLEGEIDGLFTANTNFNIKFDDLEILYGDKNTTFEKDSTIIVEVKSTGKTGIAISQVIKHYKAFTGMYEKSFYLIILFLQEDQIKPTIQKDYLDDSGARIMIVLITGDTFLGESLKFYQDTNCDYRNINKRLIVIENNQIKLEKGLNVLIQMFIDKYNLQSEYRSLMEDTTTTQSQPNITDSQSKSSQLNQEKSVSKSTLIAQKRSETIYESPNNIMSVSSGKQCHHQLTFNPNPSVPTKGRKGKPSEYDISDLPEEQSSLVKPSYPKRPTPEFVKNLLKEKGTKTSNLPVDEPSQQTPKSKKKQKKEAKEKSRSPSSDDLL
jgi:hypothetical protein